ncbi:site-specific integrase [Brevundimonas sp.]|uniref:tyrosine-type recombinase/integrase n=1 Tax=Brevundimonas sp. TaxID=1871086 RepID=UPI0025C4570C|nr:site-specific integrase [Brevundimonas sp.]
MGPLAVSRLTKPGLHAVGGVPGLALQVLKSGGRTWILRVMIGTRRREMGLGGYPGVTLAMAREAAREARDMIRRGIDPIESAKAARAALKVEPTVGYTFRAAAEAYIASHEAGWKNPKHRDQWTATLKNYAYPVMGKLDVAAIELPHVMRVLEPIWIRKIETAKRLRGRIEMVLDWAGARGFRTGPNPERWRGHLDKLLAKPSKVHRITHHRALPIDEIAPFMTQLRDAEGTGARALEFAILTAARSGEVRGATWKEIDLDARVWTISATRMKAAREHRAPLSKAAVAVLSAMPSGRADAYVFKAAHGGRISDMTISAVLRRLEVDAVPHGFRSTFRDWAAERTTYPHEVAEMALAHAVGNKVEAAYRRGDLFEKRLAMMDDWADFCLGRPQETTNSPKLASANGAS